MSLQIFAGIALLDALEAGNSAIGISQQNIQPSEMSSSSAKSLGQTRSEAHKVVIGTMTINLSFGSF